MENIVEKLIDVIFELSKEKIALLTILLLALVLRIMAAINLGVNADDMHFVTDAIGFLLSKEFFNKKVSIISAFLVAIATFHIKNTTASQDVMAMFFSLCAIVLFIQALKNQKSYFYMISGIFIGLAIYTKVYPLLFIPSMLLYALYYHKKLNKSLFSKSNIKRISLFIIVAFIFTIPALTHNYLLYKDKGFLDLQFTRTLGLGKNISAQYYSWDHQFEAKNDWRGLFLGNSTNYGSPTPTLWVALNFVRHGDPINFYLGILGLCLLIFSRKYPKDYLIFFILTIIFILPFLASIILLPKHYLFLELIIIPPAAIAITEIISKLNGLFKFKKDLTLPILALLGLVFLIWLGFPYGDHVYGKSHIAQMIEFKEDNIPINSLIIGDSRIYRGRIHWAFNSRPYLEGITFIEMANSLENLPGQTTPIEVFFFECIPDDCGWGTIRDQPDFNATMEQLTQFFKKEGKLIETLTEPNWDRTYYPIISRNDNIKIINIYKAVLPLKQSLVDLAKSPKNWFLSDIGYKPKEKQFDYYKTHNFLDGLLAKLARFVVILAVCLAFLSIPYTIYLTLKK